MRFYCEDHKEVYKSFQAVLASGEFPSYTKVLESTRIRDSFQLKRKSRQPWGNTLRNSISLAQIRWKNEHQELQTFKLLNRTLATFILDGRKPVRNTILKLANVPIPFYDARKHKGLMLRFSMRLNRAKDKWKQYGGCDYKRLKNALTQRIANQKVVSLMEICKDAGFHKNYLRDRSYIWQDTIHKEIVEASLNSQKQGKTPRELYEQFILEKQPMEEYKDIWLELESRSENIHLGAYIYDDSVNLIGINEEKKILIDAMIKQMYSDRHLSLSTLLGRLKITRTYLGFIEKNLSYIPNSVLNARNCLLEYRKYLVFRKDMGEETKYRTFNQIQSYTGFLFESEDHQRVIFQGVRNIKRRRARNTTNVDDKEASYAVSFYYNFFNKITDFLIEGKSFPHTLVITGINTVLIAHEVKSVYMANTVSATASIRKYFDFETNELVKRENFKMNLQSWYEDWESWAKEKQKNTYNQTKSYLEKYYRLNHEANENMTHISRMYLAERAFQAFFLLFSAFTGMKDGELSRFVWDSDKVIASKSNNMGIAVVKPRADYKEVHLHISRIGISIFRKAIKLRQYLLQGESCETFFFQGNSSNIHIGQALKRGDYGIQCAKNLQTINKNLPALATQKLRVFKNKLALEVSGGDLWIAAASIGNSKGVNAEHYQGETEKRSDRQLGSFVESMVRYRRKGSTNHISTSQGNCEDFNNPESSSGESLNCSNPFDCFKCRHYYATTDRKTIHKLISLQYIIKRIERGRAFDKMHFDNVLKPVEITIERILKELAIKYKLGSLLNEITTLVFQKEQLEAYWSFRLYHLFNIHLI